MTAKTQTEATCTVRCIIIKGRSMKLTTIEKSFKTEDAMAAWIDRQDIAKILHSVIAYNA